ncbi:MAG: prolyl-tRNA synthetase associated domain-containing protein [Faecalibacterium sp.]
MELRLYEGRPADCTGRLEKETKTYDLLDRLGIPFYRTDYEHADTMEACNQIDACLGVVICKNLFLCNRQKTAFYLLMMPGDKPFKTRELSGQLGIARLSFGSPEDMERLLDLTPGSVSIMGLMNDPENRVQLLMDEDVLKGEWLACHPCINTSSIKMKTADVMEKFLPAVKHEVKLVHLMGDGIGDASL